MESKEYIEKSKLNCKISEAIEDIEKLLQEQMSEDDKAGLSATIMFNTVANMVSAPEDNTIIGKGMWRFIRGITGIEMPMQILDLTGLMYPHNEEYFSRSITPTAFNIIQRQASLMIDAGEYDNEEHLIHLQSIKDGKLPYGYSIKLKN